jgi:hypothetical protein
MGGGAMGGGAMAGGAMAALATAGWCAPRSQAAAARVVALSWAWPQKLGT